MKRMISIGSTALLTLALAACAAPAPAASQPASQVAQSDVTTPPGAPGIPGTPGQGPRVSPQMQTFNQVSVEIWYLADLKDGNALTKDQATKLLAIYQDFQQEMQPAGPPAVGASPPAAGASGSPTPQPGGFGPMDPARVQSNLADIDAILTPDQLAAAGKLTQDQQTAIMQQHGLNFGRRPATPGPGTPTPTQPPVSPTPRPAGNPFLNETLKVLQALLAS